MVQYANIVTWEEGCIQLQRAVAHAVSLSIVHIFQALVNNKAVHDTDFGYLIKSIPLVFNDAYESNQ
jgi:hypothetical protein